MYNKAVSAIRAARRKIGKPVPFDWVRRYHGASGSISKINNIDFAVDHLGVLREQGGKVILATPRLLTWTQALAIATQIDQLNVGANHLIVKTNPNWLRIYKDSPRNISYMDAQGAIVTKSENTMPCHNCGVILAHEFLQVDHHMPQADGSDLHILKTMRALGLTRLPASGAKGSAIATTLLTTLTVNPKGRDRTYNHLLVPSAIDKWTTSSEGDAFLSLLAYVSALNDVSRMCRNSILNLVPLCPECNRVKSDWIKPLQ